MATPAALHLSVESGDQPDIRQRSNGMLLISIPPSNNQRQWSETTHTIGDLSLVLSQSPRNWKIEGKLK
ncbi:unnamed protein product, partial [Rotaria sp. Silwood1]